MHTCDYQLSSLTSLNMASNNFDHHEPFPERLLQCKQLTSIDMKVSASFVLHNSFVSIGLIRDNLFF